MTPEEAADDAVSQFEAQVCTASFKGSSEWSQCVHAVQTSNSSCTHDGMVYRVRECGRTLTDSWCLH